MFVACEVVEDEAVDDGGFSHGLVSEQDDLAFDGRVVLHVQIYVFYCYINFKKIVSITTSRCPKSSPQRIKRPKSEKAAPTEDSLIPSSIPAQAATTRCLRTFLPRTHVKTSGSRTPVLPFGTFSSFRICPF